MHFFAPAGELVLTPSVALIFVTPEVSQHHVSCFGAIMTLTVLVRRKTNQNKQTHIEIKPLFVLLLMMCKKFAFAYRFPKKLKTF
jgi:hypothetical protein